MSKRNAIDLMKLYTQGSFKQWNMMLYECLVNHDINRLANTRYELQVGMANLPKKKLNNEKINVWFIRLMKSTELTAKKIIKIRNPMQGDNTIKVIQGNISALSAKQKRDQDLAKFLRESSY